MKKVVVIFVFVFVTLYVDTGCDYYLNENDFFKNEEMHFEFSSENRITFYVNYPSHHIDVVVDCYDLSDDLCWCLNFRMMNIERKNTPTERINDVIVDICDKILTFMDRHQFKNYGIGTIIIPIENYGALEVQPKKGSTNIEYCNEHDGLKSLRIALWRKGMYFSHAAIDSYSVIQIRLNRADHEDLLLNHRGVPMHIDLVKDTYN